MAIESSHLTPLELLTMARQACLEDRMEDVKTILKSDHCEDAIAPSCLKAWVSVVCLGLMGLVFMGLTRR